MKKNKKITVIIISVILILAILYFAKADINHGMGMHLQNADNIKIQSTH